MHDHHSSCAIAMRVSVFFSGAAVSCPAGVAYPVSSVERLKTDDFFKIAKFTLRSPDLQAFTITTNSDPGRIIAAILESPKAIQNDGNDPLLANISDNSAHAADS